jgi:phosphoribosylformimino-5-aminoimidazole carboxamide ribotide isomerase
MIAIPAIDLKGGQVVQLVGGRPEAERVRWPDPVAVASRWVEAGFRALHVVDLDAALGTRDEDGRALTNLAAVRAIVEAAAVPVQVGGGVRDDATADALLGAGAARVIVGTRAVEDDAWLSALANRHPDRVIVAADVRDGFVLTRGWTEGSGRAVERFLERLDPLPLAGVLVTDVGREGRLTGADDTLFATLARASHHPLFAAGGIAGLDDLRRLDRAGAAGAVLGMSLYTGAVDARAAAKEFSE